MRLTRQTNNKLLPLLLAVFIVAFTAETSKAQDQQELTSVDQIVAVVNDHIILKSDVDQRITEYLMQAQQQRQSNINFSEGMWYSMLQNMVDRYVMLDQARQDSIEVSDEQVDQTINDRLNQFVQQLGSEAAVEQQLGKSLVQIRADMRENFREEMIVGQFQQLKRSEISITRPEVKEFFENIPQDSLPVIPEQVAVSQIVALPPPLENARKEAFELASQLRDSVINHDKTIEEMARKYSDGPSASDGGKLPVVPLSDLVPEYSAAASALEPGEISEVVETSFGFHVIRLNRRSGDQIDTNHILIEVDEENYDDQAAIDKLNQLRDSVLTNENVNFADLAREHSEDPNTAPQGGRILNPQTGERLLALEQLDPALYRIVLLLGEEGEISEPRQFNIGSGNNTKKAFRIVRLDRQIPEHVASFEQDYSRIKQAALQEKQNREWQEMLSRLKDEMYVEYKIPVPNQFKQSYSGL